MGARRREPRANALGWYETGPWPESEGAISYAQIVNRVKQQSGLASGSPTIQRPAFDFSSNLQFDPFLGH
jgi:hypothetical protein